MKLIIWDAENATKSIFNKEVEVEYMETLQNVVEQIIPHQDWLYFVHVGKNGKFVKGDCLARSFTKVSVRLKKRNLATTSIKQFSFDQIPEQDKAIYELLKLRGNICFSCHTRDTPQWRRGWRIGNILCNACFMRLKSGSICTQCFFIYKKGWCRCQKIIDQ
uniref:GATA zinc finger protein n=1 Tax=Marseillevirus LCMAC102 TaxID=2506603 RepID=A0A481YTB0_9VIRU|nr:MAG: GATA zinc finger protein [Marseillevirus LCMAC102]